MADFKQQSRLLAIDSPLGEDVLLLTRLEGEDAVSSLYNIEIEAYSLRKNIAPAEIVGKNVTLKIASTDETALFLPGTHRYINGFVKSFRQEGRHLQDLRCYSAVVVPWLWFLTQTSDCKIFQFKNVQEIAASIFSENGFTDFQFRLVGQHPARDYCVQYKESDFNFISRLFEEEGIYYYFKQESGKHTLIVSDHVGGYGACEEQAISYSAGTLSEHTVHNWYHSFEFKTGQYAHRDYDFKKPSNRLQSTVAASMVVPGVGKYEHFIYPGRYEDKGLGDQLTRLRVEADEAAHDVISGEGGCRTFTAGHTFSLQRHEDAPAETGEYILLGVHHKAQDYSYTINDEEDKEYSNVFRCIASATIYRPPTVTGWPRMQGPQNAIVVGPASEEIYTDEYGRVKVQFPWDRYGAYNENSSCWVRVTHSWAGKNWGNIYLPRIGQEVIVDFMDGDPDRPIITGRVYNAEQMPPYELPANKTQSGILTRSTKDGSGSTANALRFEDKMGEEEVWLHAEKDQRIEVENDESHWVGHDRSKTIDNDETVVVHHDRTETVDNNEKITIGVNRTEKVGNNEKITIGVNRTEQVGANEKITIGANRTETVGSNEKVTVGTNRMHTTGISEIKTVGMVRVHSVGINETNTVGVAQQNTVGMMQTNTVGMTRTTNVGETESLSVGKQMDINVGEELRITVGKSSIVMKADGTIDISGVDINLSASGEINLEAAGDITLQGKNIHNN